MLAYLTLTEAKRRLNLFRPLYESTGEAFLSLVDLLLQPDSEELLTEILRTLEERLDNWVGYRLAPTEYTESLGAGTQSPLVNTSYFPIIEVLDIQPIPNRLPYYLPNKDTCQIGGLRTINLLNPQTCAIVTYRAGYEPLPPITSDCIFHGLFLMLQSGDLTDFGFLNEPAKYVEELQLPSGLRKRWRTSELKEGESVADKIFSPLEDYRRAYQTGGSLVV